MLQECPQLPPPAPSTLGKARYMLDILLMMFRRQQWKTTGFNSWWITLRPLAAFQTVVLTTGIPVLRLGCP